MRDANQLTAPERSDLRRLEAIIEKGKQTFIEIGVALKKIRDEKLYREKWNTFEAYCEDKFEFKKSQAYRLIEASEVVTKIKASPFGDELEIKTETQARELAKVPEEDWQEVIDVVADSQAKTGKPATAKTFKEAAEKVAEKREEKPIIPKPGAEKVSPAKVIDAFYRAHFPPLVRGLDSAAEAIGKQGENYKIANGALNTFSKAVDKMREGKA
jgi:hypothetical protein